MAVIQARGLTRRFGDVIAVNQLDLTVEAGSVFGLLGHNGAGKTTTIRLLNGVLTPTAGTARVLDYSPMEDGPALRRRTGVLTETPSLEERLSGRENLEIYAQLYDVPEPQVVGRVNELLEVFELADRGNDKVGGYSKGMRQRLALARALLHKPELLFLDEPTSGLDPVAARQVHSLIGQMSREQGRTVVICTHNLNEAQRLCDQVAVLQRGRMIALGTPRELARQLGRSARLEIEVAADTQEAALATLRAMPQVREAARENHTIVVSGADPESVPDMVSALAASGARIYRVVPREASLEDVYFALHEMEEEPA